jgi:hypothetical protein
MADVPGEEAGDVAGVSPGRLEAGFGQVLSLFRIFVIVPVIVLLLSALASFAYGTKDGLDTLYVGAGIALVIAALTGFLRFGRVDGNNR